MNSTAPARTAAERPAPRLSLTVQYASGDADGLPTRSELRRWLAACAAAAAVTVRFVDETESRALNARYRGKDRPTNVLSFAYAAPPAVEGDLAICTQVVRREAAAQGKPVGAHFAHMFVHGILHLQGYDHESEHDAAAMEARERGILARLGVADPYAADA
jgi:probable rRNA maturation factor